MVYDSLLNLNKYTSLVPGMEEIIKIIASGCLDNQAPGAYETDCPSVRYMINEYSPKEEASDQYEFHKAEADLQVMLTGDEVCYYSSSLAPMELIDPEKDDIAFIAGEKEGENLLRRGVFVIYFPGELHQPGIKKEALGCRKAVFKIKM